MCLSINYIHKKHISERDTTFLWCNFQKAENDQGSHVAYFSKMKLKTSSSSKTGEVISAEEKEL